MTDGLQDSLILKASDSVTGTPIRFIGKEVLVKLAADPAGSISVLEDKSPPRHGPPLHSHPYEEFFYILSGTFLFEVDGLQLRAEIGDFVHAPANRPHTFQNLGDTEASMLVIARPGGIERYFAELAARMIDDPTNTAAFAQLARDHGVTILGPPISARKG